jgi:hypothetical protein
MNRTQQSKTGEDKDLPVQRWEGEGGSPPDAISTLDTDGDPRKSKPPAPKMNQPSASDAPGNKRIIKGEDGDADN